MEIIEPNCNMETLSSNTAVDQTLANVALIQNLGEQFANLSDNGSAGTDIGGGDDVRLSLQPAKHLAVAEAASKKTASKDKVTKYFLVFDLNGTLVKHVKQQGRVCGEARDQCCCIMRPQLREFLGFCLEHFEVAFWTCSWRNDALRIVDAVERECGLPVLSSCKLFSREDCDASVYRDAGVPKKGILFKCLGRLFQDDKLGVEATSRNTLLIDNSPVKNLLNGPFNVIHPEKFQVAPETAPGSAPYLTTTLQPYLQQLKNSGGMSVPSFCEQFRFGKDRWDRSDAKTSFYLELEK